MRILITGSHSTGKTTLADRMGEELGLPVIPEVARMAKDAGFELNSGDSSTQLWIFLNQIRIEDEFLTKHRDGFIADRSFDSIVYSQYFHSFDPSIFEIMKEIFKERIPRIFDKVIFLRPTIPLEVQKHVRPDDLEYRRIIDQLILSFLKELQVEYLEVTEMDFEERVRLVKSYIMENHQDVCEVCGKSEWTKSSIGVQFFDLNAKSTLTLCMRCRDTFMTHIRSFQELLGTAASDLKERLIHSLEIKIDDRDFTKFWNYREIEFIDGHFLKLIQPNFN